MNHFSLWRKESTTLAATLFLSSSLVAVSAFFGGCAMGRGPVGQSSKSQDVKLSASAQIPAADGRVLFTKEDSNNTGVRVEVKHMAQPQKVDSNAVTYVVWSRAHRADASAQPIGALSLDQDLNASLNTITTQRNFDIFVTAEPSSQVTQPSGDRLLWTTVDLQ